MERLREVLHYDPETGHFRWLITMGSRAVAASRAGWLDADSGYRLIRIDHLNYYEHRLAWLYVTGEWPADEVDHRNLHRDQNRWSNLRAASRQQNIANSTARSTNISGIKGVSFHKRSGKFFARITKNGRVSSLGYFETAELAGAAYAAAATSAFGEFART